MGIDRWPHGEGARWIGWRIRSRFGALLGCLVLSAGLLHAQQLPQPGAVSHAVWKMQTGDQFEVAVRIDKRTQLSIGDQPPQTLETTDQFRIEYRAVQVQPTGISTIAARLRDATRECRGDPSPSFQSAAGRVSVLQEAAFLFLLDAEGQIQAVSPADRLETINLLAGSDPRMGSLLQLSCPDDVLSGWVSRPFWLATHLRPVQSDTSWNRRDASGIGPFGVLRSQLTVSVSDVDGTNVKVGIRNDSRFAPLILPESAHGLQQRILEDLTMEVLEADGEGTMVMAPVQDPEPAEASGSRPQFESLLTRTRIRGTATIATVSEAEASSAPEKERTRIAFEQSEVQSWNLLSFSFGRPGPMLFPGLPVRPVR